MESSSTKTISQDKLHFEIACSIDQVVPHYKKATSQAVNSKNKNIFSYGEKFILFAILTLS